MFKKIKYITTQNGETFWPKAWNLTLQDDGYVKAEFRRGSLQTVWYPIDTLTIEYEKPQLLKRPDGSLIAATLGMDIIIIHSTGKIKHERYDQDRDYIDLAEGLIFLPEDYKLANKKARMKTMQRAIQHEIDRLNAEEGWVADWYYANQNKYLSKTRFGEIIVKHNDFDLGKQYMSSKTAEAIFAKYTQNELKQYLGIII